MQKQAAVAPLSYIPFFKQSMPTAMNVLPSSANTIDPQHHDSHAAMVSPNSALTGSDCYSGSCNCSDVAAEQDVPSAAILTQYAFSDDALSKIGDTDSIFGASERNELLLEDLSDFDFKSQVFLINIVVFKRKESEFKRNNRQKMNKKCYNSPI